jgi:hypothetical protein
LSSQTDTRGAVRGNVRTLRHSCWREHECGAPREHAEARANRGAPTGTDATNQIVLSWADGAQGLNNEQLLLITSTNRAASFSGPTAVPLTSGDRPYYTAPAISPNGSDVYITYNAFTTPYRNDTSSPRGLVGAILHADVTGGAIGAFGTLARGMVGDPRSSSQNNLRAEFLGDYVYTAATRAGAVGVWNDVRNGADCTAMDAWRLSLRTGTSVPRPAPQNDCRQRSGTRTSSEPPSRTRALSLAFLGERCRHSPYRSPGGSSRPTRKHAQRRCGTIPFVARRMPGWRPLRRQAHPRCAAVLS